MLQNHELRRSSGIQLCLFVLNLITIALHLHYKAANISLDFFLMAGKNIQYLLQIYINSWLYKNILHLNFFFTNGTFLYNFLTEIRGSCGRDRMVVGFTTTYAISDYRHSSNPAQARCTRYNIIWYSLSVTCGRLMISSTNKTGCHDISEILLNVALNTITLTLTPEQK